MVFRAGGRKEESRRRCAEEAAPRAPATSQLLSALLVTAEPSSCRQLRRFSSSSSGISSKMEKCFLGAALVLGGRITLLLRLDLRHVALAQTCKRCFEFNIQ